MPLRKSFQWTAQVVMDFPRQLAAERRVLSIHGESTFEIVPFQPPEGVTALEGQAALKLVHGSISFPEIQALAGPSLLFHKRALAIPAFTLTGDAIDYTSSSGFVNLNTGAFTHQFTIRLTPQQLPLMRDFGIAEVPVIIRDAGEMDLDEGTSFGSNFHFAISPEYTGDFRFYCFGCKSNCHTELRCTASLNETQPDKAPNELFICPGTKVHLFWTSTSDVKSVKIDPGVGTFAPTGTTVVTPDKTTHYVFTTQGSTCDRQETLDVTVFPPNQQTLVVFPYRLDKRAWYLDLNPSFCDPNIIAVSMQPTCNPLCQQNPVADPSTNVQCKPPYSGVCYGFWNVAHDEYNGPYSSWVSNPKGEIPIYNGANQNPKLAGDWTLTPVYDIDAALPRGVAAFLFRTYCK